MASARRPIGSRVGEALWEPGEVAAPDPERALLNGPALEGEGTSRDHVDKLFD